MKGSSRFRANIYMQRGAVAGAFRTIPFKILTFDELGLPPVVAELREEAERPRAGHGAHRLGQVDDARGDHRQDQHRAAPAHHDDRRPDRVPAPAQALASSTSARSGRDTEGFKTALKYVLRQDPDVVLVGEMRDLETIEAALTISETGHLVFATLHTNSAVSTINRIIDVFPPHQQPQIRAKLSFVLQGVVSQQLLPRHEAPGRVLALEVMVPNPAIRNLIREDKVHQIYSQMQVGQEKYAMQTLNQSLYALFQQADHLPGGGDEPVARARGAPDDDGGTHGRERLPPSLGCLPRFESADSRVPFARACGLIHVPVRSLASLDQACGLGREADRQDRELLEAPGATELDDVSRARAEQRARDGDVALAAFGTSPIVRGRDEDEALFPRLVAHAHLRAEGDGVSLSRRAGGRRGEDRDRSRRSTSRTARSSTPLACSSRDDRSTSRSRASRAPRAVTGPALARDRTATWTPSLSASRVNALLMELNVSPGDRTRAQHRPALGSPGCRPSTTDSSRRRPRTCCASG